MTMNVIQVKVEVLRALGNTATAERAEELYQWLIEGFEVKDKNEE